MDVYMESDTENRLRALELALEKLAPGLRAQCYEQAFQEQQEARERAVMMRRRDYAPYWLAGATDSEKPPAQSSDHTGG